VNAVGEGRQEPLRIDRQQLVWGILEAQ